MFFVVSCFFTIMFGWGLLTRTVGRRFIRWVGSMRVRRFSFCLGAGMGEVLGFVRGGVGGFWVLFVGLGFGFCLGLVGFFFFLGLSFRVCVVFGIFVVLWSRYGGLERFGEYSFVYLCFL